jgi:hypothetical protein
MKFTRRNLPATLLGTAAAVAQTPAPLPATAEEELKAAREQVKRNAETLAKHAMPMATEPAFQFKV